VDIRDGEPHGVSALSWAFTTISYRLLASALPPRPTGPDRGRQTASQRITGGLVSFAKGTDPVAALADAVAVPATASAISPIVVAIRLSKRMHVPLALMSPGQLQLPPTKPVTRSLARTPSSPSKEEPRRRIVAVDDLGSARARLVAAASGRQPRRRHHGERDPRVAQPSRPPGPTRLPNSNPLVAYQTGICVPPSLEAGPRPVGPPSRVVTLPSRPCSDDGAPAARCRHGEPPSSCPLTAIRAYLLVSCA
jgi:hypothetical protein